MLQIISLLLLLFSLFIAPESFAQANVPAFLQNEAVKSKYENERYQQKMQNIYGSKNSREPAFIQKEREEQQQMLQQIQAQENQFQYQSADTNSVAFTLPPASYQPAPGDTPAFINQEQNPQPQEDLSLKTTKKEDVIQINFSEDQYKNEDEITRLNEEQAIQYNSQVQKIAETPANPTTELQEGERFNGTPGLSSSAKRDEENLRSAVNTVPEPVKKQNNLIRLQYAKEDTELSEKDKKALLSILSFLKSNKFQKVEIKAFTSERDYGANLRKIGLMRVINIREFLMKQGVDFSQTEVKVFDEDENKEGLDYIDIDKI